MLCLFSHDLYHISEKSKIALVEEYLLPAGDTLIPRAFQLQRSSFLPIYEIIV